MIVIYDKDDLIKDAPENIDGSYLRKSLDKLIDANIGIIVYNNNFKVIKNRYLNTIRGKITDNSIRFEFE